MNLVKNKMGNTTLNYYKNLCKICKYQNRINFAKKISTLQLIRRFFTKFFTKKDYQKISVSFFKIKLLKPSLKICFFKFFINIPLIIFKNIYILYIPAAPKHGNVYANPSPETGPFAILPPIQVDPLSQRYRFWEHDRPRHPARPTGPRFSPVHPGIHALRGTRALHPGRSGQDAKGGKRLRGR